MTAACLRWSYGVLKHCGSLLSWQQLVLTPLLLMGRAGGWQRPSSVQHARLLLHCQETRRCQVLLRPHAWG